MTGVNCNIFGYISNGEMVPEVITTLLKRSKTGLIAMDGSRHLVVCMRLLATRPRLVGGLT